MEVDEPVTQNAHWWVFCVSSNTSEYQYSGQKRLYSILKKESQALKDDKTHSKSQYLIFSNINEWTFLKDFSDPSSSSFDKLLYSLFQEYIPALSLLLIKMNTEAHEQAHSALHTIILRKLASMNSLDLKLRTIPQSAKESNGRTKKADQSYKPRVLPPGREGKWPSVVIHAAWSQPPKKLADDARWWLEEPAGDVKAALTIAVNQTIKEIKIEKWELAPRATRQNPGKRIAEVTRRVVVSQ
ncbi:hypothetical protein PHISCL_06695 [Aspergillus sclerotialis]|uniref:Uncharacterized protein n=1 Tax=Aspergillus sclerotialis TaxID=2070753 RepID=A0A3A2ZCT1_9EURO|nr:hypothetical protein PHISCL_06695 [Aspergillus sclerotialis]